MPEIASRKHIEKINQVIEQALADADVTLDDLDLSLIHILSLDAWRVPWKEHLQYVSDHF